MSDADATCPAAILDRWRAIEQAATPGPWEGHSHGPATARVRDVWHDEIDRPLAERVLREADLQFIVTARTAMPLLVAAIEAALKAADEAVPALGLSPADCTYACDSGDCDCSGVTRPVAWNLDPADLRAAIASALTGKEGSDD
jgi:hypothetical protein